MAKLRHAAALALVGWYLMIPPDVPHTRKVNLDATLGKWSIFGSYDSADECTSDAMHLHQEARAKGFSAKQLMNPTNDEQHEAVRYETAECIATDDPRLKEK